MATTIAIPGWVELTYLGTPGLLPARCRRRPGPAKGTGGRPRGRRLTNTDIARMRREIGAEVLLEVSAALYARLNRVF